jgi:ribosomal protein S12 methylthiotransferase
MGRKVTKSQIIEKIEELKEKIPELTLRTSLICGFPGETDEEFEELCQFVNKGYFQYLGAFAYSPEEDTPAFSLPDMVDEEVSEARVDKIMEIQQKITFNWLDTRLGSNQELIIDNIYENEAGQSVAICRSRCEAPEVDGIIYVNNTKKVQGDVIRACLNARNGYDLEGVSE